MSAYSIFRLYNLAAYQLIIKQLTYEFALQQTHTVAESVFFIPWYYTAEPEPEPLGETEQSLDIKGIQIFKANFFLIQKLYLENL
ncbi:hypothetical protein QUB33_28265 [Microcoleus sp. B3-A4]|uniref:hypothetical protein n=1 Tax=Microcoleus sp. B3-A4 TaxID=2818653 RepID=UPI002FD2D50B